MTGGGMTGGGTAGGGTATGGGGATGGGAGQVVRFIAIGDQGKANTGQNAVGAAIGTFCGANPCDFVVLLGDNFYQSGVSGTTDPLWQTAFVQPYATVNVPFYAVLGNHDYGGEGLGTDIPKGTNQVNYSMVNPKWRMPATHYHWVLNHVEFFGADTNRSMFSIDQDVRGDFDDWFAASTATWKIVFAHHPYKSNGEHGNAGSYDGLPFLPIVNGGAVKSFVEQAVCGKADFYITGHDHHLEWIQATCTRQGGVTTNLVVSGGGASSTSTPGNQPTYFKSAQIGFAYIVIQDRTFTLSFYDENGAQLFTRTITK